MNEKSLRVFFISGLLLLLQTVLYAQGKIAGSVLDSQSSDPLPAANVYIEGTNYGSSTDLNGKFVISQVPVGNYKMVVKYIGYQEKTVDVSVKVGETLNIVVNLDFQSVEGEVVTVTAQAEGQMAAINEQLSSNTISNIVSQSRIKEVPDVNAAESIGRLPGVSISRSGGEATAVSIRGLSPKYNVITVNGVRVPSFGDNRRESLAQNPFDSGSLSGGNDRSVDLSLISSSMLDGIEVKKAITADMDGDALGGTVDLRLKEAPQGLAINGTVQSGYNKLQDDYGNYNFTASASNRFFDNLLGIIASINKDDYDRSADKLDGDYRQVFIDDVPFQYISNVRTREENVTRGRTGGSLLFDYQIPNGKVVANSFYNQVKWDGIYRIQDLNIDALRHNIDIEKRGGTASIFTGGLGLEQNFDWIKYDIGFARTSSRNENPNERAWRFTREGDSFTSAIVGLDADSKAEEVPTYLINDSTKIGIQDIFVWNTENSEDQSTLQLNTQIQFRLSNQLKGSIKTGGKFRWLDRTNDQQQYGRNGLYYGNNNGPNDILTELGLAFPSWGVEDLVDLYGVFPISALLSDYSRSNFLEGDFPLGFAADISMLNQMTQALDDSGTFRYMSIGSLGNDYEGTERYQAGYVMAELKLGKKITFIPGARYENEHTDYTGYRFRETTPNNIQGPPADLDTLRTKRDYDFWLPMIHLQVQPSDWLKIRLAYTQTLTRPDYIHYAPIARLNSQQNYGRATNSLLKPAQSKNYDAAVSVYQNHVGLFTVAGFYKDIDDLIFQVNYPVHANVLTNDSLVVDFLTNNLNIPINWITDSQGRYRTIQYGLDTFINNPFPAKLKGVELDWQTHFWYLPSFLSGIVLNVNYTHILSDMEIRQFFLKNGARIPRPGPPTYTQVLVDSSRTSRLPDQPAHIANITLGYDFKGFSARLSYLYQTDRLTFAARVPEEDNFSGDYQRWDLTLQQKIGKTGLQLFANFTNLKNRPDQNFRTGNVAKPTYIEYYGFILDLGARYIF